MLIAYSENRLCLTTHRCLLHHKGVGCRATSDLLRVRAFLSGRQRVEVSMVFLKTPNGIG
jgi:hypothetical protein